MTVFIEQTTTDMTDDEIARAREVVALWSVHDAVRALDTLRRQRDEAREVARQWEQREARFTALVADLEAQLHEAVRGWYATAGRGDPAVWHTARCPRCRREAAQKEAGE